MYLEQSKLFSNISQMVKMCLQINFLWISFVAFFLRNTLAEPVIVAKAPVNPVQQDGVFSLHCEVRNLRKSHEVTVLRSIDEEIERLSVDKDILPSVDERMFLSFKQVKEGNYVVYFLTITQVRREDEGRYSCRVTDKATASQVVVAFVDLKVMYFPSDSDPQCSSTSPLEVREGQIITLNCSSEMAFPIVNLEWSQADTELQPSSAKTENGRVYTIVNVRVSRSHSNAVFLCSVTSTAFPDQVKRSCHIGPLRVKYDPNFKDTNTMPPPPVRTSVDTKPDVNKPPSRGVNREKNCRQLCPPASSKSFFWIVSTVIAALLAVAFFIIGMILFIKYCRLPSQHEMDFHPVRQSSDNKLYAELESRQTARQVYMRTEKRDEY